MVFFLQPCSIFRLRTVVYCSCLFIALVFSRCAFVICVFIMPSDKRDSVRKSDRTSSAGLGSGRPSATVTSGAMLSVSAASSSRSGAVCTTAGTVHSVSSVAGSKSVDRVCPDVDTRRGSSCTTTSMFGPNVDDAMPNIVEDVCDAMLSDDSMSGARRAPVGSNPMHMFDSRDFQRDDRRHTPLMSSRSADFRPMQPAVGGFAAPGYGPGSAPMSFPPSAGWGPSAPPFHPMAFPSMAAAGRGVVGFGAGYAPAYGWPTIPTPWGAPTSGIGSYADRLAWSGRSLGPSNLPATQRSRSSRRPEATVSAEQCQTPSRSPTPETDTGGERPYEFSASDNEIDTESHTWRDDAPPDWDQEATTTQYQGLHEALGSYSDVLEMKDTHAEAQSFSEQLLGSDFVQKSRPRIAESPLIAKVLSSARKRLAAPGSARTVPQPDTESDHSVLGRPVGDLIPSPPNPFPVRVGWSFPSFRERFQTLSVSSSETQRLGTSTSSRHYVSAGNLKQLESSAARSLAGVGALDTLFAAMMSALSAPGSPVFALASQPDVSAVETLVKHMVLKLQQSAAEIATLYTNIVLLRRDSFLTFSSLPGDVRALVRASPIQQPWLFGPAAGKIMNVAAESASRDLALSALASHSGGRSSSSGKRKQSFDSRRAKAPRLDHSRPQRQPFPARSRFSRGGRAGSRQSSRSAAARSKAVPAEGSSSGKNPQ